MLIGSFDTEPFETLAASIKNLLVRPSKTLRRRCKRCVTQFERIGETPEQFTENIEKDRRLFDFLAQVLRRVFNANFKFVGGAHLTSLARSIKNAIDRISRGHATQHDYNLCIAFADQLKQVSTLTVARAA